MLRVERCSMCVSAVESARARWRPAWLYWGLGTGVLLLFGWALLWTRLGPGATFAIAACASHACAALLDRKAFTRRGRFRLSGKGVWLDGRVLLRRAAISSARLSLEGRTFILRLATVAGSTLWLELPQGTRWPDVMTALRTHLLWHVTIGPPRAVTHLAGSERVVLGVHGLCFDRAVGALGRRFVPLTSICRVVCRRGSVVIELRDDISIVLSEPRPALLRPLFRASRTRCALETLVPALTSLLERPGTNGSVSEQRSSRASAAFDDPGSAQPSAP